MKYLKEFIDDKTNEKDIDCFDFNEFSNLEIIDRRICGTLQKAKWESRKITVVLKSLNNLKITENDFKEFVTRLEGFCKIDHSNINRFFGLTRNSCGNYFSVSGYANEGNLRDYLKIKFNVLRWKDILKMALDVSCGLMYLHFNKVIHGNLHARNVLVNSDIVVITDFRLPKQMVSEEVTYIEPRYLRNPSYELDMKSDIYSLGVLLWELSSGHPPFLDYIRRVFGLVQVENKLLKGEREEPAPNTPSEYQQIYQKCWQGDPNLRPVIDEVCGVLSKLLNTDKQYSTRIMDGKSLSPIDNDRFIYNEISDRPSFLHIAKVTPEIFESSAQQIIRQLKLNHGIILNGCDIIPSIQEVVAQDGELKMNLYEGSPLVYTSINSENNELKIDTCINFQVAEIVYNDNLLESLLEYPNDEMKLRELYGDFLARKFLVGGQLFIEDFNSATIIQADILKNYLFCVYNLVKFSTEIPISNLFTLDLLPKLITLDGKKINTHEKLINWMNDLYQKKIVSIISYGNLIPISRLKDGTSSVDGDLETFEGKQPGIANFEKMLDFEDWSGDVVDSNLMGWTEDFDLFRGFIVNEYSEIKISKKIPVDIIKIPKVKSTNKCYLKIIKPSTDLEVALSLSNIFSIKDLSKFPFIKNNVHTYEGYDHVLIKSERYEIISNEKYVKPTKEFEQIIEKAINSMKPLKILQDIFNEYGHLFSQRIILGGFLKEILPSLPSYDLIDDINNIDEILNHLGNLNISSLVTKKGRPIEKNDIYEWIQNHLEVIKFDNIIPLYKILKIEQQEKIEDMLKNDYRIIMTGVVDLIDLKNNENYKRISFGLSMESENYEVFGSIISENNVKLEEFYVNFALYDFNGFYAMIKKSEETCTDITKCYVSWIVIGKPSKLSVFSPNNRDLRVDCIKKSIKLQLNKLNYTIKLNYVVSTSLTLHEGYTVFVHVNHSSIIYETNDIIKLVEWKERSINVQIESTYKIQSDTNSSSLDIYSDRDCLESEIDLRVCILPTNYKSLKIDKFKGSKRSLDLIGYILNKENFNGGSFSRDDKDEVFVSIHSIMGQSLNFQPGILELNDKKKKLKEKEVELKEKETKNIELRKEALVLEKKLKEKEVELKEKETKNIELKKEALALENKLKEKEGKLKQKEANLRKLGEENAELRKEASKYQSALGNATNPCLGEEDSVKFLQDILDLQKTLENYVTNLKPNMDLDYEKIQALAIKYGCSTPADKNHKLFVKALLQRKVLDDMIELFKNLVNKSEDVKLEMDIEVKTRELLGLIENFSISRSESDKITEMASRKVRQQVYGILGDRGFADVTDSNGRHMHDFITYANDDLNNMMNQHRKINDANKRKEVESIAPKLIQDFCKLFFYRLNVQEPIIEYKFYEPGSKIDPNVMKGNWDEDDVPQLCVDICSFPTIGYNLASPNWKIYTSAKVYPHKISYEDKK
ncbi:hypothetical protein RclHR1_15400005 [Rhizophagus clarus]|uniref:Kinase-like domain-containing protein n=1 Tax=Rhizophagus clarus TaxID=94130 RepID=A0A2Z6QJB3_9GLOM|nr:hypothetical protein RclHR1_15400005 [Rhizophagus clarus]GES80295.1 kinase-like domain-containing protein [Rhizophagus clarus]